MQLKNDLFKLFAIRNDAHFLLINLRSMRLILTITSKCTHKPINVSTQKYYILIPRLLIIILIYWIQNETDIFYIAAVNEQMIDFVNVILCWVNSIKYNNTGEIRRERKKLNRWKKKFNNKAVGWKIPIMLHRNDNVTIEIIFHVFQYATGRQIWLTLYILFISFTLHSDFVCPINFFEFVYVQVHICTTSNTNWPYSMINSMKWTE